MIVTEGTIKFNPFDALSFVSPVIIVEAVFKYPGWSGDVVAKICSSGGAIEKRYQVDGSTFTRHDTGDGNFAVKLGFLVESLVAEDLRNVNPDGVFTVVL